MKFLILLVCLLHAIPSESVELRRENGKGTKRSASSARGKPQLFRVDPNVCVCLDKNGIVLPDCDPLACDAPDCDVLPDIDCDAPDDFLTFNCYGELMELELEKEMPDAEWDTIRDDILLNRVNVGVNETCFGELEKMLKAQEERIQETPKFQATIRKIKIKGEDYRSSPVIVDIVGPQQVSDITVDICFKDPNNDYKPQCSGIKSFAKQIISHTFVSSDFGLRIADEVMGEVKVMVKTPEKSEDANVMGELLRSEATFTAKTRNDLAGIGAKMYDFLEGGDGTKRIADIDITFTTGQLGQLDVTKTHATASLNKNGYIVMMYGDILIGGMSLENFND